MPSDTTTPAPAPAIHRLTLATEDVRGTDPSLMCICSCSCGSLCFADETE